MPFIPGLLPEDDLLPNNGLLPQDAIGTYRRGRTSTTAIEPVVLAGAIEPTRRTGARERAATGAIEFVA